MARYIQHPQTGKLIPAEEYARVNASEVYIHGDIEAFKSPIDGSIIADRAQLRAHNARHGVTDSRDYSADYYKRKAAEREGVLRCDTERARAERRQTINEAIDRFT